MKYSAINELKLTHIKKIIGDAFVYTDTDSIAKFAHDETEDLKFFPEVIVKPRTAVEISELLKFCNQEKIPVTPRGAGTGLSGGALPVHKGIVLSMERFSEIIEIDERNLQATVESGVITEVFQNAVKEKGLFYPPDPASKGSCFIGGNIAENSGGPKAVKYGVTKDYVLNLEVVLPNGEIIWTGANTLKNSTGYNLTQLFIGSEGTLGIVTKIVFKLLPFPKYNLLLLLPFYNLEESCKAVSEIFKTGIIPSGVELMERDAIQLGVKYVDDSTFNIDEKAEAYLLIELDGNNLEIMNNECEEIVKLVENYSCGEILFAEDSTQKERLWKIRRAVGEAVKKQSIYKEEDTVVPRAELPTLLIGVKKIGEKYGFKSICYGHAGDGNLHVNILKGEMNDDDWQNKIPIAIQEIFKLCVQLKGTISGEHGIGWVQKRYMNIPFSPIQINIQKEIKKLFDPSNILNPDKMFP